MTLRHFVLCALLASALPVNATDAIKLNAAQLRNMNIQVLPILKASAVFGKTMPAQVVIPPAQMRMISAPQAGMLEQLTVAIGDRVSEGQVLARIQSPDLIALQRDLLQAASQERLARTALKRDDSLLSDGVIAQRRQQETHSRHQELSAAVEERRQALRLAGMSASEIKTLESTHQLSASLTVRSPIAGVVLETKAEAGQRVMISDPIYRIAALNPLWLEIRSPLEQTPGLEVGARVRVQESGVDGKLIAIGRNVDPASQTVLVRAEVAQNTDKLRPGQYVQAAITTTSPQTRYQVPSSAIVRNGRQTVVFVQTPQGFEVRPVTLLATQSGRTIISGSFSGSEKVASSGLAAIKGAWMGLGGAE